MPESNVLQMVRPLPLNEFGSRSEGTRMQTGTNARAVDEHENASDHSTSRAGAVAYVALAFGWSWGWWGLAIAAGWPSGPALLVGGAGPLLAALVVVARTRGRSGRRVFWLRVIDPRRIRGVWWLALLAVALGGRAVAGAVAWALGVETESGLDGATTVSVLGVIGFALVAGFAEEPGWRGVLHDGVRSAAAVSTSGAVVGVAWAAWHVPLYFLDGTFQHGLGFGSASFWLISITLIPLAVLYACIVEGTAGSILAAVLTHAVGNAASELLPVSTEVRAIELAVIAFAAGAVVLLMQRRSAPARRTCHSPPRTPSGEDSGSGRTG
jgi:uncharacterized protein